MRRYHFRLLGTFRLLAPDGRECVVRGSKDRALLVLLCLARERRMVRALIQDKLWSDRGQEQGAVSLRQSLSQLRKVLGPGQDVLGSNRSMVWLNEDRVACDLDDLDGALGDLPVGAEPPELFEDLTKIDPEFDDWARDRRLECADRVDEILAARPPAQIVWPGTLPRARLALRRTTEPEAGSSDAQYAVAGVISALDELNCFDIIEEIGDARQAADADFTLTVRLWHSDSQGGVSLALTADADNHLIMQVARLDAPTDGVALEKWINTTIDMTALAMVKRAGADPALARTRLSGLVAASEIFRSRGREAGRIGTLLDRCAAEGGGGVPLAWKGFLLTYLVGERRADDPEAATEEAVALVRQAIEREPTNATVLALASYVYSFLQHDYFTGFELASRAVQLNPRHALAHAFLGCANVYLGRAEVGRRSCLHARRIAGTGPHRYLVDTLCFIASAASGRLDDALALAESTHQQVTDYAPPLRYLSLLYRHRNDEARAAGTDRLLRGIEPDFSPELMRERSYPMRALRRSGLLNL